MSSAGRLRRLRRLDRSIFSEIYLWTGRGLEELLWLVRGEEGCGVVTVVMSVIVARHERAAASNYELGNTHRERQRLMTVLRTRRIYMPYTQVSINRLFSLIHRRLPKIHVTDVFHYVDRCPSI
jgi:hypothetical protein